MGRLWLTCPAGWRRGQAWRLDQRACQDGEGKAGFYATMDKRKAASLLPATLGDRVGLALAVLSATEASKAALFVQPCLLALRLEVAAVPELSEDPGPLHGSLEALQEAFPVLTFAECYKRQADSPCVFL